MRPFFGRDRHDPEMLIAVTSDLRKRGVWRVTWIKNDEPWGHAETGSFTEAVRVAVRDYGLDLDTVQFHAERDRSRRRRRTPRERTQRFY